LGQAVQLSSARAAVTIGPALLEAIAREWLVKTEESAGVVVICELWSLAVAL
jgi:hypothetical protein